MKIGLSTCGKVINKELFRQYRDAGIDLMELSMSRDEYGKLDFAEVKRLSEEYGITLWSLHLPFYPFDEINIASSDPSIREHTVMLYKDLIAKGAAAGIRYYIVHPSGEPNLPEERAEGLSFAKQTLKKLAGFAAGLSATICVEDLPRTCLGNCSSEILELLSADDRLRVCFDTNHLLTESAEDFVSAVGDRIVTTHISDYDFLDEKHWLPGEGRQNWQKLIFALKKAGYDSAWLYEAGFKAPATITRPRDLTANDFALNAKALFDGRTPERIR